MGRPAKIDWLTDTAANCYCCCSCCLATSPSIMWMNLISKVLHQQLLCTTNWLVELSWRKDLYACSRSAHRCSVDVTVWTRSTQRRVPLRHCCWAPLAETCRNSDCLQRSCYTRSDRYSTHLSYNASAALANQTRGSYLWQNSAQSPAVIGFN